MLTIDLLGEDGIVVISPQAALETADFERLSGVVDPYIAANGALRGLLVKAASFPGWESIGALFAHLAFVAGHHNKVGRVAVVSNSEMLKLAPHIAKHFVAAEIQRFPAEDEAQALAWLKQGAPGR